MSTTSYPKTALITGSNRGLGLEFVRQLADSVDRLFATCRRPQGAAELSTLAEARPETIDILELDVADPDSISGAAARVEQEVNSLDLLVNNAGISGGGQQDTFDAVDQATLMKTFEVNAAGPHLLVKAFRPPLNAGEGKRVVLNVTSGYGSIADAGSGGWHSYRASKAALNMLTRVQAHELRDDGVTAVAMNPGWARTDMGGSSAPITPKTSVAGMLEVIDALSLEDTGRFLDYQGNEQRW